MARRKISMRRAKEILRLKHKLGLTNKEERGREGSGRERKRGVMKR